MIRILVIMLFFYQSLCYAQTQEDFLKFDIKSHDTSYPLLTSTKTINVGDTCISDFSNESYSLVIPLSPDYANFTTDQFDLSYTKNKKNYQGLGSKNPALIADQGNLVIQNLVSLQEYEFKILNKVDGSESTVSGHAELYCRLGGASRFALSKEVPGSIPTLLDTVNSEPIKFNTYGKGLFVSPYFRNDSNTSVSISLKSSIRRQKEDLDDFEIARGTMTTESARLGFSVVTNWDGSTVLSRDAFMFNGELQGTHVSSEAFNTQNSTIVIKDHAADGTIVISVYDPVGFTLAVTEINEDLGFRESLFRLDRVDNRILSHIYADDDPNNVVTTVARFSIDLNDLEQLESLRQAVVDDPTFSLANDADLAQIGMTMRMVQIIGLEYPDYFSLEGPVPEVARVSLPTQRYPGGSAFSANSFVATIGLDVEIPNNDLTDFGPVGTNGGSNTGSDGNFVSRTWNAIKSLFSGGGGSSSDNGGGSGDGGFFAPNNDGPVVHGGGNPLPAKSFLELKSVSKTSVTFKWTAINTTGSNEKSIYRNGELLRKVTGHGGTFTDSELQPDTTYVYKLSVYNSLGIVRSTPLSARTEAEPFVVNTGLIAGIVYRYGGFNVMFSGHDVCKVDDNSRALPGLVNTENYDPNQVHLTLYREALKPYFREMYQREESAQKCTQAPSNPFATVALTAGTKYRFDGLNVKYNGSGVCMLSDNSSSLSGLVNTENMDPNQVHLANFRQALGPLFRAMYQKEKSARSCN